MPAPVILAQFKTGASLVAMPAGLVCLELYKVIQVGSGHVYYLCCCCCGCYRKQLSQRVAEELSNEVAAHRCFACLLCGEGTQPAGQSLRPTTTTAHS